MRYLCINFPVREQDIILLAVLGATGYDVAECDQVYRVSACDDIDTYIPDLQSESMYDYVAIQRDTFSNRKVLT